MTLPLSRRATLGAGLATLMPAPPPALFLATVAAVPMVSAAETVPAISLDAAATAPEVVARASHAVDDVPANLRERSLRGDDTVQLPDHAAFWAHLPLPFSLTEAWHKLSPATQAEIGAAVIGMVLAEYISGDMHGAADHFHDDALRSDAMDVGSDLLTRIEQRLWVLFPDLYGPDGDHPAWALNSGMAPIAT